MVRFTHVLCPTDLSEASRPSLTYAAAVARRYGAGLTVLHAVPPFGTLVVQSGEAGSSMPMVFPPIDDVTAAVRAFALDALAGLDADVVVQTGIRPGSSSRRLSRRPSTSSSWVRTAAAASSAC